MTLGLRPEHLTEVRQNPKPGLERDGRHRWTWSNRWAWRRWCTSSSAATPMCARIDPNAPVAPNETLQLHADMNNMHLLDPQSGRVV